MLLVQERLFPFPVAICCQMSDAVMKPSFQCSNVGHSGIPQIAPLRMLWYICNVVSHGEPIYELAYTLTFDPPYIRSGVHLKVPISMLRAREFANVRTCEYHAA